MILAIILVIAGAASYTASRPAVCGSCHVMRQAVDGWASSTHFDVTCLSCHKKTAVLAIPILNLEETRMTANSLTGKYQLPISSAVDNEACLGCHSDIKHGVQTKFQTMMSHAEVMQAGISCLECHDNISHTTGERIGISMMEKCSSCHNDEIASSRCQTCHLSNVWLGMKPAERSSIVHDSSWPKTHGSRNLYMCKNCHSDKDCTRCHATTVPHPEGWPYIHGQEAKKSPDDCNICHVNGMFCKNCHNIQMPHPTGWLALHNMSVEVTGQEICKTCHPVRDCKKCHDDHAHNRSLMQGGANP
jgi:hypothetical protein